MKKWRFIPIIMVLVLVFVCACGDSTAGSSLAAESVGQIDESSERENMGVSATSMLNGSSHIQESQTDFDTNSLVGWYRYEIPNMNQFFQIDFYEDGSCKHINATYEGGIDVREGHYSLNGNEITLSTRHTGPGSTESDPYENIVLLFTREESFLRLEYLSGDGILPNVLTKAGDTAVLYPTTPIALAYGSAQDVDPIVPPVEGVVDAEGGLNMRMEPTAEATSIELIDDGTSVAVLGTVWGYDTVDAENSDLWYYIEVENGTGYVHSDYLILPS